MSMTDPASDEPVRVFEDVDTGDRFLIYDTQKGLKVELRYEGDSLWMSQAQMADLFGRDVSVISRHIANIFEEGELPQEGDLHFMQIRGPGNRPVAIYSLDMVISVGYRVSSTQATLFRRWATTVLVRFATKGFVVDVERLRDPADADRIAELRDLIREIRSSEANVYAELRRICSMCQDYDPSSEVAREFYRRTQAKLFYAVVNRTPSELIVGRTNASAPNMGLHSWPKDQIRQQDATVAKNYLAPAELKELNRLTTILLDIFEDQLEVGRLTLMADASRLLDNQLQNLGRVLLQSGGSIPHERAEARAKSEYKAFNARRKAQRKIEADAELRALKHADKALPKAPRSRAKTEVPAAGAGPIEPETTVGPGPGADAQAWTVRVAGALGISPAELDDLEWTIDENASDDGVVYGHIITFSEDSDPAVLRRISGLMHGRWVQIGPVF